MPDDPLEQLARYADAVDRAAQERLLAPAPVPSVALRDRFGLRQRAALAAAAVLVAVVAGVGIAARDGDEPSDEVATGDDPRPTTTTASPAPSATAPTVITGESGCAVTLLPGPDPVELGPPPDPFSPTQPSHAHAERSGGLLAEIHVPGYQVTDLVGEDVELTEIDLGQAALWHSAVGEAGRPQSFTQLRYFRGGQEPCHSFTVTATGGTATQQQAFALAIGNRLVPTTQPVEGSPTTTAVATTTTALICPSGNPACGPPYWDPPLPPNRPTQISIVASPASPRVGEEVTFTVTVDEPDGWFVAGCGEFDADVTDAEPPSSPAALPLQDERGPGDNTAGCYYQDPPPSYGLQPQPEAHRDIGTYRTTYSEPGTRTIRYTLPDRAANGCGGPCPTAVGELIIEVRP